MRMIISKFCIAMFPENKRPWSRYALIFIFTVIAAGRILQPDHRILSWDNFGYYLYLPNYFIYHDPGMEDLQRIEELRQHYHLSSTLYQVYQTETGHQIIRYSMGNAVFYAPFFFVAHAVAPALGYRADGFSRPYHDAVMYGSLIYALLSLVFARKILRRFLNERHTAITLVLLYLGTNLFHMLAYSNGHTHANLFFLYTLIVWLTLRWHETPSMGRALALGLLMGLAIITRPTEIVCLFIPVFWGISGWPSLVQKLRLLWQRKGDLVVLGVAVAVVGIPQMLYWKKYAGHYLYRSYDNPGEGLDLFSPHTWPFLFSYQKGWLLYTPMMWLALAGLVVMGYRRRQWALAVTLFFLVNLWLTSSWTNWWYAGSFGSRAIVQSYGVMLLPLGMAVQALVASRLRWAFWGVAGFFLLLNQFQTWQYNHKILHAERMTKAYYWKVFGRTSYHGEYDDLLMVDRGSFATRLKDISAYPVRKEWTLGFENPEDVAPHKRNNIADTIAHGGQNSFRMDTVAPFLDLVEEPYHAISSAYYGVVRISGWIYTLAPVSENPISLERVMHYKGRKYYYSSTPMDAYQNTIVPGQWNYVVHDYITPPVRTKNDVWKAYLWLQGKQPVWIDDLTIRLMEGR